MDSHSLAIRELAGRQAGRGMDTFPRKRRRGGSEELEQQIQRFIEYTRFFQRHHFDDHNFSLLESVSLRSCPKTKGRRLLVLVQLLRSVCESVLRAIERATQKAAASLHKRAHPF